MQRARHQFLAGSCFTVDADARLTGGNALNLRHYTAHGLAGEDQCMFAHTGVEVSILDFKAGELERVFHRDQQLFGGERLLKKVEGAEAGGTHRHLDVRLAAHHDYRCGDAGSLKVLKQRQAIAAGHHYVAEDEIEKLAAGQFQSARRVVADDSFVACQAEGSSQRSQGVGFVVDNENPCFGGHDAASPALGNVMTKIAPPPGRLWTAIAPAWSATTD